MSPIRSWPNRACGGMPKIIGESPSPPPALSPKGRGCFDFPLPVAGRGQGEGECRLLLHQGAVALVDGPERLLGGGGRARLVVVPRPLGLGRLLDLEQVHGVQLAAVGADRALAEQRIVGGGCPRS